jgi:folate-binding protein YgfZ
MTGYEAIRRTAVLSTVPRSVLVLEGGDTFDFLHRMSTNELRTLGDGESRPTVIVNEKGRVVDLVTVRRAGARAILAGSPGGSGALTAWFERFIIMDDVRITLGADLPAVPALYGPEAGRYAGADSPDTVSVREDLGRIPGWLFFPAAILAGIAPLDRGPDFASIGDLESIGPDALETVRVEELVPATGRELGPEVNALEAGLKSAISFSKGCYIGQEVIARLDTYRKLRTIIAQFSIAPAPGRDPSPGILMQGDTQAGRITSVAYSSFKGGWIGLGFRQIRSTDSRFELLQGADEPPAHASCISPLPPGYEEYEIEG